MKPRSVVASKTTAIAPARLLALATSLCLFACAQRNEWPNYDAATASAEAGAGDVLQFDQDAAADDGGQDGGTLAEGTACVAGAECRSGFCADGVCCASACTGQCEACNVENKAGACVPVVGAPKGGRSACAGEGACAGRCNGEDPSTCHYPSGAGAVCGDVARCDGNVAVAQAVCNGQGACAAPTRTSCDLFSCEAATGKCSQCSDSAPCGNGQFCVNGRCENQLALGAACASHVACSSGFCASGVCCDRACDGGCEACGAEGKCTLKPAGAVCRTAKGSCDVAETCSGAAGACPADAFTAANAICRASSDACDIAEACSGSGPDCPADLVRGAATVCRPAAGECDVAESCTGFSGACPADQLVSMSLVCRAAAGECDVPEICSGTSPSCPANAFASSGQVCRAAASANACDVVEVCSGTSAACPADAGKTMCSATSDGCCPQGCFMTNDGDCTGMCPSGQKACAGSCIANSKCCNVNECPAMAGKVATCSPAYQCVYSCPGGSEDCGDGKCRSECVAPTVVEIALQATTVLTRANSPTGVSTDAKVLVKFSEAMNTSVTQGAVTLTGFVGSYAWSPDGKTLTITPTMLRLGTVTAGTKTYVSYSVKVGAAGEDTSGNKLVEASRTFVTLLQGNDSCQLQSAKSGYVMNNNGTFSVSACPTTMVVGDPSLGSAPSLSGRAFLSFDCSKIDAPGIVQMNSGRLRVYKDYGETASINVSTPTYATFDASVWNNIGSSVTTFGTSAAKVYYELNVQSWANAQLRQPGRAGAVQFGLAFGSGSFNVFTCNDSTPPTLELNYIYY